VPNPIDVVEALLFASDVPLEAERIREVLDLENAAAARELATALMARYEAEPRGLSIVEVGGGYRMVTRPELAPSPACGCRGRRWRRWPSSPTSSPCPSRSWMRCVA
jgi:hypothetical protein